MEKKLSKASMEIFNAIWKRFHGNVQGKTMLTFDISTSGTGWSYWRFQKNGKITYLDGGVIKPKGKTAKGRFPKMASGIIEKISEKNPDLIISEEMFFRKQFASIEYPLKLHGIEEYAASIAGILDLPIVTSTWRSLCGFKSNIDLGYREKDSMTEKEKETYYKDMSIQIARTFTNLPITDDNHADSICIGMAVSKIIQIAQNSKLKIGKNNKISKR